MVKSYSRPCTYIAADWDGDKSAVQIIQEWNNDYRKFISFKDAHDLMQARDNSLNCSIKASLCSRLDESYKFILVVGNGTKTVRSGSCQYCSSLNSYSHYCARRHSVDYRSYIDFECQKAVRDGLQIVILYNSGSIDRDKCLDAVRWQGTHKEMWSWNGNSWAWDYNKIATAIGA
jgi:hypothetical protein